MPTSWLVLETDLDRWRCRAEDSSNIEQKPLKRNSVSVQSNLSGGQSTTCSDESRHDAMNADALSSFPSMSGSLLSIGEVESCFSSSSSSSLVASAPEVTEPLEMTTLHSQEEHLGDSSQEEEEEGEEDAIFFLDEDLQEHDTDVGNAGDDKYGSVYDKLCARAIFAEL
eukprot:TRINITY_DN9951_c0_g1_i1.p1 TRINITY_DN9951_c0_g1~~TRINITY_DN9951_c0_g1_i1.p1  ORF type:complete len:169 (+),score=45.59 TRINITY_DN9951_c0_g1_i1:23-529(+)